MLFASTPADKAILPTAWGGRYFFNRIGQKLSLTSIWSSQDSTANSNGLFPIICKHCSI